MTLFDPSAYFLNFYAVPPFISAVFLLTLAIVVLIREKMSPVSLTFALLVMSGVIWLGSYAGILSAREEAVAVYWIRVENAGVVLIPTFFLFFALVLAQKLYRYRVLLWGGFSISYFYLVVTSCTNAFVAGAHDYPWGYFTRYGPLAAPFFAFFAAMMAAALYVLREEYGYAQSLVRQQRFRQILRACFLVQLSLVDVLAAFGFRVYPFGYIFVLVFVVLMTRVIMTCRFTDITPAFAAPEIIFAMTEGLLVLDREGLVRIANPAFCRLSGQTEKNLLGSPVWKTVPDFFDQEKFAAFLEGRGAQGFEVSSGDGEKKRFFNVAVSAVRDAQHSPEAVLLVIRDVTEQRLARELLESSRDELERKVRERTLELEAANQKLRVIDERKTRFLALAAHELRTPLTSIHGFLSYLLQGSAGAFSAPQMECLNLIKKASDRLRRLVSDLLDITRIELGQMQMKMSRENPGALMREELELMSEEIARKEILCEESIESGLPEVVCDRDRIKEVLDNLLSNALKYTPRGGRIQVGASAAAAGGVKLTVRDTGIGIKPEHHERIFEPFEHLRQSGLEGETSTGLGLSFVKQIVEAHGGSVMVASEEGKGALFTVVLPAAPPDIQQRPEVHSRSERRRYVPDFGGR